MAGKKTDMVQAQMQSEAEINPRKGQKRRSQAGKEQVPRTIMSFHSLSPSSCSLSLHLLFPLVLIKPFYLSFCLSYALFFCSGLLSRNRIETARVFAREIFTRSGESSLIPRRETSGEKRKSLSLRGVNRPEGLVSATCFLTKAKICRTE